MTGHWEADTPAGRVEAALNDLGAQMEIVRKRLEAFRNAEVEAEQARNAARRRALLSPQCPRVRRDECTVAERDAWVEEQAADDEFRYQLAKTERRAAGDHLYILGKQISALQSIGRSVGDAYRDAGRQR